MFSWAGWSKCIWLSHSSVLSPLCEEAFLYFSHLSAADIRGLRIIRGHSILLQISRSLPPSREWRWVEVMAGVGWIAALPRWDQGNICLGFWLFSGFSSFFSSPNVWHTFHKDVYLVPCVLALQYSGIYSRLKSCQSVHKAAYYFHYGEVQM